MNNSTFTDPLTHALTSLLNLRQHRTQPLFDYSCTFLGLWNDLVNKNHNRSPPAHIHRLAIMHFLNSVHTNTERSLIICILHKYSPTQQQQLPDVLIITKYLCRSCVELDVEMTAIESQNEVTVVIQYALSMMWSELGRAVAPIAPVAQSVQLSDTTVGDLARMMEGSYLG